MKIVVTGSLGHISKPLTEELVQKGHSVIVISSNSKKQKEIEALGAVAAIGSMTDVGFLTKTFTGADAVYTMVPPHDFFDADFDLKAHYENIIDNYVTAISKSGVKRVVHLSSVGADMVKDSGIILLHHAGEAAMNKISGVGISIMRPTAFYYNLLAFLPTIKQTGNIFSNYGEGDIVPWVAPVDIATAIAEELTTPLAGKKIRYVASEEMSCTEIAGILGKAIGKPDMKWMVISNEQMQAGLDAIGMPRNSSVPYVEMNSSMHSGLLLADYFRNRPVFGKTKMTEFARDFAAAYNQN
jgi:uncharacterized protein YbjT (DUF2867 family)